MSVAILAFALAAATPLAGAPVAPPAAAPELAAQLIFEGRSEEALAMLEKASAADPHDAAVLINLGIAYAHAGEDAKARAAFERAAACHEVVDVAMAGGGETDSRRLARKALRMLARGEFRTGPATASQLTYRDR